jgi:hypothetical protein
MGSGTGGSTWSGYFILLAIVFAPVALVWCNAGPYRIIEWFGWVVLFFPVGNL